MWVKRGLCSADSIINLALCMLGVVPGVLHAWYIIFRYPDPFDEYARVPSHGADAERGGAGVVTWYFVSSQPPPSPSTMAAGHRCAHHHQQPHQHLQQQPPHEGAGASRQPPNYGTTGPAAPSSHEDGHGAGSSAGEGAGAAPAVPPTYEQAIKGDHKVQAHD